MRSAVLFLPSLMTVLMNLVTSVLLYTGSAASSRFGISLLRGMSESLYLQICDVRCGHRSTHRTSKIEDVYCFGLFAPYFERPCLRPCTPTASSVPRTT